jgi:hypothetical protein
MPPPVIKRVLVPVLVARPSDPEAEGEGEGEGEAAAAAPAKPVAVHMGDVSVQATFFGTTCVWLFVTDATEPVPFLGAGTVSILGGDGRSVLRTPLLEIDAAAAGGPHAASLMASGNLDQVSSGSQGGSPQSTFAAGLAHRLVKKFAGLRLVVYAFCSVSEPKFVGTVQSGVSASAVAFSGAVFTACCQLIEEQQR